jgi:hypothetical protein
MAEAAAGSKLKLNGNLILNAAIGVLIILLLIWGYYKFIATPAKPAGALTQAEYDALTAAVQATYHKDTVSGYWVKNAS